MRKDLERRGTRKHELEKADFGQEKIVQAKVLLHQRSGEGMRAPSLRV